MPQWWWRTRGGTIDKDEDVVEEEEGQCRCRHCRTIMPEACARFAKLENMLGMKECTNVANAKRIK